MRPRARISARSGSTLIELIVALAVLGVSLGVAAVAFRSGSPSAIGPDAALETAVARRMAIEGGRAVSFVMETDSGLVEATAYPDGRVHASGGGIDLVTGRFGAL